MSHASARPIGRRRLSLAALALAAALSIVGCSPASDAAPEPADGNGVSIEHAHGTTVIPEKPKRIVTLGWMTADIVAALGENPVGVEKVWGAGESGFQPWFEDYVTEEYGETPALIEYTEDGPNYEAIKALKPDLILGLYTGLTDVEYQRLSEIAPTVPYLERPWDAGTWEDMTRTVGKAMWADERAEQAVTETTDLVASLAEAHPEFTGKSVVWGLSLTEGSTDLGVYLDYDPRVRITEALGFDSTSAMSTFYETAEGDNWYTGVSLERLNEVDADLFAAWAGTVAEAEYTVANKVVARWAPIAKGSYVFYAGEADASAISAPTVLSLQYILPTYVDDLAEALAGTPTIAGP